MPERNKDETQQQKAASKKIGGLGMKIKLQNGRLEIAKPPIEGMPAQRAGIREGDQIIEIDGKLLKGMTKREVDNMLRGEIGAPIKIIIKRKDVKDAIEVSLIRVEEPKLFRFVFGCASLPFWPRLWLHGY